MTINAASTPSSSFSPLKFFNQMGSPFPHIMHTPIFPPSGFGGKDVGHMALVMYGPRQGLVISVNALFLLTKEALPYI